MQWQDVSRDATSALYNQGKCTVVKLAPTKRDLHPLMDMFVRASSSHDDVTSAGERFMLALYGADKFATLNKYRHVAYKRGLTSLASLSNCQSASLQSLLTDPGMDGAYQGSILRVHSRKCA